MDALLGASPEADDPLGLGLPGRLQPLAMAAPGAQSGSPLSPVVALHNPLHAPMPFAMPQVRHDLFQLHDLASRVDVDG